MAKALPLPFRQSDLAAYCRRHHITKLSFFGSILRSDFTPQSDVDVLVDFEEGHAPGLLGLAALERELSTLFGRRVDLNTKAFLNRYFADEVLREAQPQYVAA